MDTVKGTLDVVGWSWLFVSVCDEQTDCFSKNSCN